MVSKTDRTRRYSRLLAAASLPLLLILVWWLYDSLAYVRSTTPTGVGIFWPASEATLNLRLGCPPNGNLSAWGPCWDDAARDAAQQWNAVGARFTFRIQSPSQPAEPTCSGANADRINTVVWADTNCGMAFGNDTLAITQSWFYSTGELVDSDVLFDTNKDWTTYSGLQRPYAIDFHRVAIHEFGHVLGLGHPDEHGQVVDAIMNSKTGNIDRLQTDDINGTRAIYGSTSTGATRTSALGIPGPGTTQSGVGVISGWKCRANGRLTVRFDGGPAIPLVYGSQRSDVRDNGACLENDHDNVGFVAIWNWGRLAKGRHTAVVYDNGIEFARSTFTVVTTGVEFLSGVTGSGTATLSNGQRATLTWSEASQSFVATEFTAPSRETTPPVSGVGQFLGTWRFTNSHTTQTYRFPRVETCRGDAPTQCVYDDSQGAGLGTFSTTGTSLDEYSYALAHPDGAICRFYFLYEPAGNTVRGHYGYGFGSCTSNSATDSIAEDIVLKRYSTTGRRISQSTSQAFSLEVEEEREAEEDVTQEDIEDVEMAIKHLLDGIGHIGSGRP